jgi:hypothetical protein
LKPNAVRDHLKFYIDGRWVDPVTPKTLDISNPTIEAVVGRISMGSAADVDRAGREGRSRRVRELLANQRRRARGAAGTSHCRVHDALRRHGCGNHRGDGRTGGSGPRRAGAEMWNDPP